MARTGENTQRNKTVTLNEAYEEAGRRKKGLIVSGQIGGRQNDCRLLEYLKKNGNRQCGISDETRGYLIVRIKPGI